MIIDYTQSCSGYHESACCGQPLIGCDEDGLCSSCKEHSEPVCFDCEDYDECSNPDRIDINKNKLL